MTANDPNQQPPRPPAQGSFDANKPTIVALLYLGSFITGITGLVGLILAFVWKNEVRGTWQESHLEYHIMTGIVGFVASIIGFVLLIVLIGGLVLLAVAIWFGVRTVLALIKAQNHEPIPDPKTLLW